MALGPSPRDLYNLAIDEQERQRQANSIAEAQAQTAATPAQAQYDPRSALRAYQSLSEQGYDDQEIESAFGRMGWPMPPTGVMSEFTRGLERGGLSSLGAASRGLGALFPGQGPLEGAAQGLENMAQRPELAPGVSSLSDIEQPSDVLRYGANLIGQTLPETAAIMGAGAAAIAAAPVAGIVGAVGAGTAAGFAASYLPNLGRNVEEQLDKGVAPDDVNLGTAAAAAVGQSALDSILEGRLGKLVERGFLAPAKAPLYKRIMREAAVGSAIEAPTEAAQEVLQIIQADPNIQALMTPEAVKRIGESAVGGALVGGLFGAGEGTFSRNPPEQPPPPAGEPGDLELGAPERDQATLMDELGMPEEQVAGMDPGLVGRGAERVRARREDEAGRIPDAPLPGYEDELGAGYEDRGSPTGRAARMRSVDRRQMRGLEALIDQRRAEQAAGTSDIVLSDRAEPDRGDIQRLQSTAAILHGGLQDALAAGDAARAHQIDSQLEQIKARMAGLTGAIIPGRAPGANQTVRAGMIDQQTIKPLQARLARLEEARRVRLEQGNEEAARTIEPQIAAVRQRLATAYQDAGIDQGTPPAPPAAPGAPPAPAGPLAVGGAAQAGEGLSSAASRPMGRAAAAGAAAPELGAAEVPTGTARGQAAQDAATRDQVASGAGDRPFAGQPARSSAEIERDALAARRQAFAADRALQASRGVERIEAENLANAARLRLSQVEDELAQARVIEQQAAQRTAEAEKAREARVEELLNRWAGERKRNDSSWQEREAEGEAADKAFRSKGKYKAGTKPGTPGQDGRHPIHPESGFLADDDGRPVMFDSLKAAARWMTQTGQVPFWDIIPVRNKQQAFLRANAAYQSAPASEEVAAANGAGVEPAAAGAGLPVPAAAQAPPAVKPQTGQNPGSIVSGAAPPAAAGPAPAAAPPVDDGADAADVPEFLRQRVAAAAPPTPEMLGGTARPAGFQPPSRAVPAERRDLANEAPSAVAADEGASRDQQPARGDFRDLRAPQGPTPASAAPPASLPRPAPRQAAAKVDEAPTAGVDREAAAPELAVGDEVEVTRPGQEPVRGKLDKLDDKTATVRIAPNGSMVARRDRVRKVEAAPEQTATPIAVSAPSTPEAKPPTVAPEKETATPVNLPKAEQRERTQAGIDQLREQIHRYEKRLKDEAEDYAKDLRNAKAGTHRGNTMWQKRDEAAYQRELARLQADPKHKNHIEAMRAKLARLEAGLADRTTQPAEPAGELIKPPAPAADEGVSLPAVEQAAAQAAREPTDAQKEAGNYKKGHVSVQGLDISIETPAGENRTGTAPDGTPWSVQLPMHYGAIRRTEGADGENVDVYLSPGEAAQRATQVFVVDQIDLDTGRFDEHKAVIGPDTEEAARALYALAFSDGRGPERIGGITAMSVPEFKQWLKGGDQSGPAAGDLFGAPEAEQERPIAGRMSRAVVDTLWAEAQEAAGENPGARYDTDLSRASANLNDLVADDREYPADMVDDIAAYFLDMDEPLSLEVRELARREGQNAVRQAVRQATAAIDRERVRLAEITASYIVAPKTPADRIRDAMTAVGDALVEIANPEAAAAAPARPAKPPRNRGKRTEPAAEAAPAPEAAAAPEPAPPAPEPAAETPVAPAAPADPKVSGIMALSGLFKLAWRSGKKPPKPTQIRDAAIAAFGGSMAEGAYDSSDLNEAIETGINADIVDPRGMIAGPNKGRGENAQDAAEAARRADFFERKLDSTVPTQTRRSDEKVAFQQFSTPPHYAFAAVRAANVGTGDVVLEPSAGTGSIAVWAKADGATVLVNEISPRRRGILGELGFDRVFDVDAEQLDNMLPDDVKPTVIVMNPPFSAAGQRGISKDLMVGAKHIQQALNRLEPGGRLVAIVGRGMGMNTPTFGPWWAKIRQQHTVRANIAVSGDIYTKFGTSFETRLLVIDKTGPQGSTPILQGEAATAADLIRLVEGVRSARTPPDRPELAQPGAGGEAAAAQGASVPGAAAGPAPDTGGTGTPGRAGGDRGPSGGRAGEQAGEPVAAGRPEREGAAVGGAGAKPDRGRGAAGDAAAGRTDGTAGAGPDAAPEPPRAAEPARGQLPAAGQQPDADTPLAAPPAGEAQGAVFETYAPTGRPFGKAKPHGTPLVQSAAMASVAFPPLRYTPDLPAEITDTGALSDAQLETVAYAGQAHEKMLRDGKTRQGFFIGDGTGVGKGRQVAGIILDNLRRGRKKAVWLSKNKKLLEDAARDWTALGGKPDDLINLQKYKPSEGIKQGDGVLFVPYGTLSSNATFLPNGEINTEKAGGSRISQIKKWLPADFDGVIAFDESHLMGNALPMSTGFGRQVSQPAQAALAGLHLQRAFPNARVVYVSATGATEVSNLSYTERLGLWGPGTPFANAMEFVSKINSGGLAAMELVARDLKQLGLYTARGLSMQGVRYERIEHELTPEQTAIYSKLAEAWQVVLRNIFKAIELTEADGKAKGAALSQFWSMQQMFFNQVMTSMQMPTLLASVERDIKAGNSVVLQLVNHYGSRLDQAIAGMDEDQIESMDIDLTPKEAMIDMVRQAFPVHQYEEFEDEDGNRSKRLVRDKDGNPVENREAVRMRDKLIGDLASIRIPNGPVDLLMEQIGAERIAEVTGRSKRVVYEKGRQKLEKRSPDSANRAEIKAFQDGRKRILLFSMAGGTGASYHADLGAKNQQLRRHYVVQAGWIANAAIQGFGRTHRTNQAQAPEYVLASTNLAGHKRFVSSIARRVEQLGALTKGQRQAGGSVFSEKDNLEGPYSNAAMYRLFNDVGAGNIPGMDRDKVMWELGLDKVFGSEDRGGGRNKTQIPQVPQFLNRILSATPERQTQWYEAFQTRLDALIDQAIANGSFDAGMQEYKADRIKLDRERTVWRDDEAGIATNLMELTATKPADRVPPEAIFRPYFAPPQIFRNVRSGKSWRVVFQGDRTKKDGTIVNETTLQNAAGRYQRVPTYDLRGQDRWQPMTDQVEARTAWAEDYKAAPTSYDEKLYLLTGTLLPVWDRIPSHGNIYRMTLEDGRRIIGKEVTEEEIAGTLEKLGVGRRKIVLTPEQAVDAVKAGGQIQLSPRDTRLVPVRVAGETRIEMRGGVSFYNEAPLLAAGVFTETHQYQRKYFVPTGARGAEAMRAVLLGQDIKEVVPPEGETVEGFLPQGAIQEVEIPAEERAAANDMALSEEPAPSAPRRRRATDDSTPATHRSLLTSILRARFGQPLDRALPAMRRYVQNWGIGNGTEALAAVDAATGEVIQLGTDDAVDAVNLSADLTRRLRDPKARVVLTHNHPSGSPLSAPDISMLLLPGAARVEAILPDGKLYAAWIPAEVKNRLVEAYGGLDGARAALTRAMTAAEQSFTGEWFAAVSRGQVPLEVAAAARLHPILQALEAAGIIGLHAEPGRQVTRVGPELVRRAADSSLAAIRGELARVLDDRPAGRDGRAGEVGRAPGAATADAGAGVRGYSRLGTGQGTARNVGATARRPVREGVGEPDVAYTWEGRATPALAERPDFIAAPRGGPVGRIAANLRAGMVTPDARRQFMTRLAQNLINVLEPIKEREVRRYGALPDADTSAFKIAEMALQDTGRYEMLLHDGPPTIDRAGQVRAAPGIGGLEQIFNELQGPEDYGDFQHYVYANRAQRLIREGRERLMSAADIAAGLAKRNPRFDRMLQGWQRFNTQLLQYAVDTGTLSPQLRALYEQHMDYVPFYRVYEETGELLGPNELRQGLSNPSLRIERLVGGTQKLQDLFENISRNARVITSAGLRNVAMERTHQLLTDVGEVDDIPADQPKGEGAVSFYRNGERQWFRPHDPAMFVALAGMRGEQANGIIRGLAFFANVFRTGVTSTPAFMLRNLIRGSVATYTQTGGNLTMANNTATGFMAALRGSPELAALKSATGMGGYGFGNERVLGGASLRRLTGAENRTLLNRLANAWAAWESVGEATEMADRLALFNNLRAQGVSEMEAAYQASNVLNYSRKGAAPWLRTLTMTVPFLNARLQGLYRMFETQAQGPERQRILRGIIARGLILSALSLGLWAWTNSDDEDRRRYEEEPLERRMTYWMMYFGGTKIMIPKPFEIGHLFATLPEALANAATKENGSADLVSQVAMMLGNTFGFETYFPIPQALLPALETATNFDFFRGRPIESESAKRLPPGERTGPGVSMAATILGEQTGASPLQLQHLIDGYGGALATTLLAVTDTAAGMFGLMPERPGGVFGNGLAGKAADVMGLRSMVQDADVNYWSRWVNEFYEAKDDASQSYNAIREAMLSGDIEHAKEIVAEKGNILMARPVLSRAETQMTELNRAIRQVYRSPKLSGEERQKRLDPLIITRNRLAENVVKLMSRLEDQPAPRRRAA